VHLLHEILGWRSNAPNRRVQIRQRPTFFRSSNKISVALATSHPRKERPGKANGLHPISVIKRKNTELWHVIFCV
jgi:hypothetical protein